MLLDLYAMCGPARCACARVCNRYRSGIHLGIHLGIPPLTLVYKFEGPCRWEMFSEDLLGEFGLTEYVVKVQTTDENLGESEYGVVHEVR